MKLIPTGSNVAIVRDVARSVTAGGIVMPDVAKGQPQSGVVASVGPGVVTGGKRVKCELKVGDKVFFPGDFGRELEVDGKKYLVMDETDVIAKLQ